MRIDRNNGTWPKLKAKRHNKFDDAPLKNVDMVHSNLDGETLNSQKITKDRAPKQLSNLQNMVKDMADYADNQDKHN